MSNSTIDMYVVNLELNAAINDASLFRSGNRREYPSSKSMKFINKYIKPIYYRLVFRPLYHLKVDHFPKNELEKRWLQFTGMPIDWNNPQTLNEKIQWLICYSDTAEWTRLADKILVREYVKEKGLGNILIPLVGTWKDARDIDFEALPDKCVLKCNHDSGSVVIIDKSKGYNKEAVITKLNRRLKIKYGYLLCEPHYNKIKPCILCEKFLDLDTTGVSTSPIDYKVFCYNGKPDVVWVAYNRNSEYVEHESYDLQWNHKPEWEAAHYYYRQGRGIIPCPKCLPQMLESARILSAGFPQVRIDFYDIDGTLYFGEMTFTSDSGRMPYFSEVYQKRAGALIKISVK